MFQWVLNRFSDDTLIQECNNRDFDESQLDRVNGALTERSLIQDAPRQFILEICDERDIPRFQEPVDRLDELEDTKGNIYAWNVDGEEKRDRWLKALAEYQETNGEFKSVHFVLTDSEELHRLDKDDLEPYL